MGFFQTFAAWLDGQLASYIGDTTARVAAALEPAVLAGGVIYVMAWGFLQLTGRIDEPVLAGVRRIVTLAVVFGVSLRLWLYNEIVVDTFYRAPSELAGAVVGAADPISIVDAIWDRGGTVAGLLWANGGVLGSDFGFYIAGAIVWFLVGLLCVYTMFLLALAKIALAVLLALGPLFIALMLFGSAGRIVVAWLAQLVNYALVTVLTVLVAALLLRIVQSYATQTAALGSAIVTVDALNMVLAAALVFLLMRQVMPIAAGIAGGVALTTFGVVSRAVALGLGVSSRRLSGAVAGALE